MEMQGPAVQGADPARPFRDVYERGATEAAFLWVLRSLAADRPHYTLGDLAKVEGRLDDQLDLLMSAPELGWQACEAELALQQPGEAFTATVVALRSHDVQKIQTAIQAGIATDRSFKGVVSALGWLPAEIARPWVERLLKGKDMRHKLLGVAACSVRRENPGELLNVILSRDDCRQYVPLHARALRLVGELRRQDLMPTLQAVLASNDAAVNFWSNWSSILLGQRAQVVSLRPFITSPGPYQQRAIQLAFRTLPVEQGREWISTLAKDGANPRAVITATGVLGDPHAVNWLISMMSDPAVARLAGEAFTHITGIDLAKHALTGPAPHGAPVLPNDDPMDTDVGLDEDEYLPWPDAGKIAALWRSHGQHFLVGRRYFFGRPITPDWLTEALANGTQRARHAAALELALIDSQRPLANTRARGAA